MIGRLTGSVIECKPDHVMLDVAGVGYYLQIPLSTYYTLCEQPESTATLQVHTHVREDALNLYGFLTRSEKETFEMLIGISGIGPRVALAFLSGTFYSVERLPGVWRTISSLDPFFYMIDGFRYGFIGQSDSALWLSMTVMIALNVALFAVVYRLFATGYKLKS